MFLSIFKTRVRLHAQHLLDQIFAGAYEGEVFLCGGAFKPLLKRKAPTNELDFWVRDRKERERLTQFLLARGAVMARDFQPYGLKLRLDGRLIEITYHNVKDGALPDILNTFDLSLSGIGARYQRGRAAEVHVAEECWHSLRRRTIQVLPSYLCAVQELKVATIISTLHGMGQQAAELEFDVDQAHEHLLWDIFWNHYTEEDRRAAMEFYFETTISQRSHIDERLHRRPMGQVAPGAASEFEEPSLPGMTPQRA